MNIIRCVGMQWKKFAVGLLMNKVLLSCCVFTGAQHVTKFYKVGIFYNLFESIAMYNIEVHINNERPFDYEMDSAEEVHEEIQAWEKDGDEIQNIEKYTIEFIESMQQERLNFNRGYAIITRDIPNLFRR